MVNYSADYDVSVDFRAQKNIIVNIKQGSHGKQNIYIRCLDGGKSVPINKDSTRAIVKLRKPDNRKVIDCCDITDDGRVKLEVTETIAGKAGRCYAEILLYDTASLTQEEKENIENLPSNDVIATMDICINIYPTTIKNEDIESKDEFRAFDYLVSRMIRDYLWILDENHGIIGSVKSINGRQPDEDGAFVFTAEDYQTLIDETLKTAKESGMFDGRDGIDGVDGYTPVKFVDYFTEADLVELGVVSKVCGKTPDDDRNIDITCDDVGAIPIDDENLFVKKDDGAFESDVDMSGHSIVNVKAPVNDTDCANKKYVDDSVKNISFRTTAVINTEWLEGSPCTNTIPVTGITDGMTPHITPLYNSFDTYEDEMDAWSNIYKAVTGSGVITFYSSKALDISIPIQIEVIQ